MHELIDEITEVQPDVKSENKASIGRFDSPETLYNSYVNLQRDYTRKCQLLKEAENAKATANAPVDFNDELNALIEKMPEMNSLTQLISDGYEGSVSERLAQYLLRNGLGESNQYNIDELKSEVYRDEELRQKIFSEMIEEFVGSLPPKPVKNRGKTVISAAKRPKSLSEATSLAAKIIKNRRIE